MPPEQPEGQSQLDARDFLKRRDLGSLGGRYLFLPDDWLVWIVEQVLKAEPSFAPQFFSQLRTGIFASEVVVPPNGFAVPPGVLGVPPELLRELDPVIQSILRLGRKDPKQIELFQPPSSLPSILGGKPVVLSDVERGFFESLLRPKISIEISYLGGSKPEFEPELSKVTRIILSYLKGTRVVPSSLIRFRGRSGPKDTILLNSPETYETLFSRFSMIYEDKRIITAPDGLRYVPIALAAWVVQTNDRTLRRWIEDAVTFNERSLKSYLSPVTQELYLSQQSVEALENRFVKWPSQKPAGPVTIGEAADKTGFLALSDVARLVGVSAAMMWEWTSKGQVPSIRKSLNVIKCPISDQLYLREDDAVELAKIRHGGGLKRGRIPQNPPRP